MRIPTAASMKSGIDDRFDRVLREATAATESTAAPAAPAERETPPAADEPVATTQAPKSDREVDDEAPAEETETTTEATDRFDAAQSVDVTDNTHRGEPVRQETAGKGADSPRISTADAEPLLDGARTGAMAKATPVPVAVALNGAAPTTAATPNGEQGLRGVGATAATSAAAGAARATRAQAGYATRSAAQAQLVEHARDSVFKQILLKLSPEGGEMRMRLEPPQLGELDLRLTMGEGNRLSLAIAAERSDVQQLLQRHLDELKQVLQANGLEVTDAQVQTQSQFARERDGGHGQGAAQHEDHAEDAASAPLQRGYVTAEGLDFWA
ncbi:MAG: flagellar hook-length control protein FliK [Planctomycetota bacterium]